MEETETDRETKAERQRETVTEKLGWEQDGGTGGGVGLGGGAWD